MCKLLECAVVRGYIAVTIYSSSNAHLLDFATDIKGTVSRDFPRFFSSNNTPWAPDSQAKALLNSASNSPRYSMIDFRTQKFFVR
jgi:hypothetical protein